MEKYDVFMEILYQMRDQRFTLAQTPDVKHVFMEILYQMRNQPIRDRPIHNQPIREQPIREQPTREQPTRDKPNIQNAIKIEGDANQITIVSNSHDTIDKKLTKMREVEDEEIPNNLQKLVEVIIKTKTTVINDKDKNKILQLLEEFIDYATSPDKENFVLRDMWHKLQESTKNVKSISQQIELMWPIISKMWIS